MPNVLCLVFDAMRADAIEPYGAPRGSTPTVAQLASSGVALPHAYATATWTLPSHASMFTGLLPRATGVGQPGAPHETTRALMEAQADRTLSQVLRGAGFQTAAVSANLWVSGRVGFEIGFDEFASVDSGRQGKIHDPSLRARMGWATEVAWAGADDGAREAGRILESWIERLRPGRPFFWFVNLVECHSPYLPPRPYNDLGLIGRLRAGFEARRHLTLGAIWRACVGEFDVPESALERMRHLYSRSISYMDGWLARLLEALENRGALDETIVIVTSDHGENLGEGGLLAHAFSLDDRLLHVPLVISGPAVPDERDRVRSLAELPRLIAELTGLEGHPWRREELPDEGVAVAQLDPPVGRDDPRAREVAELWDLDEGGFARLTTPFACATDGGLKLIRRESEELVYDLAQDPLELDPHPLASGSAAGFPAERISMLRRALDHPAATARPDAPPPSTGHVDTATPEEIAALEERMRLLGYL